MNVLITGGTGFIGSRLALRCLEQGDRVKVFGQDNNTAESENKKFLESKGVEVVLASVTDKAKVEQELKNIDIVFHLAATQHEMNVPDQRFWDVNVAGTRNMLEASVNNGVRRFIHGSTIGVYGSALEGNVHESSLVKPDNIYGVTKLEGEKLVASFFDRLPVVTIRISETYGPGDRRLLKLFRVIKKKVFFMIGNGKNLHHLIYVDDLIDGFLLAVQTDQAVGKLFVLAGKDVLTTNEMVKIIADYYETSTPPIRVPLGMMLLVATLMEVTMRPIGLQPPLHRRRMDFFKKSFMFSQDYAKDYLGFVPKVGFAQGVAETARWYQEMDLL